MEKPEGRRIIKFTGFDDIDDELEEGDDIGGSNENGNPNKRRRGGRKRNRRQKMELISQENLQTENGQKPTALRHSRLLQEMHDIERVRGMKRNEARELLQAKLLFLGDQVLQSAHLSRFSLVVPSEEMFELEDGSSIPAEIVSVSMDYGKINSILRFYPSKNKKFEIESTENFRTYRMKRVFWNPSIAKDVNSMFYTWSHFLSRSLLSLLLVPLNKLTPLMDFLRKINEMRTVLNNRATTSICLSRVVAVDDFLTAIQDAMDSQITLDLPPIEDRLPINYALDYSYYHIESTEKIVQALLYKTTNHQQHLHQFVTWPQPIYYETRAYMCSQWAFNQDPNSLMDAEKYHRISQWLADVTLAPIEEIEQTFERALSLEEEEELFGENSV